MVKCSTPSGSNIYNKIRHETLCDPFGVEGAARSFIGFTREMPPASKNDCQIGHGFELMKIFITE